MVKILQVTDLHLQADPADLMQGVVVEHRWQAVLADIRKHHLDTDLLLLTGDLVHHAGPIAYQRLKRDLDALGLPAVWIPGNHDDVAEMAEFGDASLNRDTVNLGRWCLVLLNSTDQPDGCGGGGLSEGELQRLDKQLQRDDDKHLLLILHHNPLALGSVWQDAIALRNTDQFWSGVQQSQQVKGVIFGHVHQQWILTHNDVALFSSPAIAPQYKACCVEVTLEDNPALQGPAYTVYQLLSDGEIQAKTVRLAVPVAP